MMVMKHEHEHLKQIQKTNFVEVSCWRVLAK